MHSRVLYAASGLCFIAAAGFFTAAGYALGKKQAEKEFDKILEAELASARRYNVRLAKREEYSDPSKLVDKGDEEDAEESVDPKEFLEVVEVIASEGYQPRMDSRTVSPPPHNPQVAYVISSEEFFENPKDYDQRTLTYYSKDDVLIEEHDVPIDDVVGMVGPVALDEFGNGSKDPNIVYVRNDRISMDFEICFDPDSFEETVLGHIKHSEIPKVRKFRLDDDG
jgi:hypothetical protein